jgi:uncharacterized protein (DUF1330 family)
MPAYIVFTKFRTRNQAELDLYLKQASDHLTSPSIKWLARFGKSEVKEGTAVEGVGILEFPTMKEARAWYNNPGYQDAARHRFMGGDYSAVIVEGVASDAMR